MSKLTKNDLKYIVKECLIEILAEGLSGRGGQSLKEQKRVNYSPSNKKQNIKKKKSSHLDSIVYGEKKEKPNTSKIKTNISDNNVLNELFADTARHTLQEQIAADSHRSVAHSTPRSNSDAASKIVSSHTPEEIFGDAASKWSKLAFFDS
jgi:hypothetical protein